MEDEEAQPILVPSQFLYTRAKEFRNVDHEGLLLSREEMRVGFIS